MAVTINLDFLADAAGTVDVITATYVPAPPSLYDGLLLYFFASGANLTTTPTFNPNILGARTIVKKGGVALVAGDIPGANALMCVGYDLGNTRWELLNPATPTTRTGVVREYWIGAGALTPRTTNGAASATVETTTNDITYDVLDFDQTTSEGACFQISLPGAWNVGTVKAKFYWTAASGAGTVTWSLKAGSLADDDVIDTAYGTPQAVTDTLIATGDMHITAATAAITIAGTPAVDDWLYFEVSRDIADTLNADARLIGIKIQYTETTVEPSSW